MADWTCRRKDCTHSSIDRNFQRQIVSETSMTAPTHSSHFAERVACVLVAESFSGGLAPRDWIIRQETDRCGHLLAIETRRGSATLRGSTVSFGGPALLWLPSDLDGHIRAEAGARGAFIAIPDDLLTKTIAGSAEALHLRRTVDRFAILDSPQTAKAFGAIAASCDALVHELHTPGRGSATLTSSHILLLCLYLWRLSTSDESVSETARRGDGPRLVGNFLQMVELHYRDGWPIARYAAALGVTDDRLHAHCKHEKGRSPRAIIHERLVHEACTRLMQLDLPVEQIGYGLGFRDPAYFNRFFRKHRGESPGVFRRRARLDQINRSPTYAAWP